MYKVILLIAMLAGALAQNRDELNPEFNQTASVDDENNQPINPSLGPSTIAPPEKDRPRPPAPDVAKREGCGWRNPDGVDMKITRYDDGQAKFGEFPWMVGIIQMSHKLNLYVGGGSLIHPSVVLTAAHLVPAAKELRVRAGEWNTQTIEEIYSYQDRNVSKTVIHRDFDKGNLSNDIALLFLSKPVDLAPNVGVVCLPPPLRNSDPPSPGTRCLASGWGKDSKKGQYQVILKKMEVQVVSNPDCEMALQKTRLDPLFRLHASLMCASGLPGRDTCKDDDGSPLVCPLPNVEGRYVQNGIVADVGCGEDGVLGVYVDVARLREWIDDQVKGQGFDIAGYSYV